jgi:hypothetical protein
MERIALPLTRMAQTHWQEVDQAEFARAWEAESAAVPEFTDSELHIVTGLLLPIWKQLPDDSVRKLFVGSGTVVGAWRVDTCLASRAISDILACRTEALGHRR